MGNYLCNSIKTSKYIDEQKLKKATYDNTKDFSLETLTKYVRIVDIYDGDTCICVIVLNNNIYKFHIRLAGIDTCEKTSKDPNNKNLAIKARNRLFELITNINLSDINNEYISRKNIREYLNKECYLIKLKCGKFDKYGRLLGHLYSIKEQSSWAQFCGNNPKDNSNKSFNEILINEKLAYPYEGGTKLSEEKQTECLN